MEHYFTNNETLESKIKEINYTILDKKFTFFTDLGVFSKDKVDFGTDLLLKTYLSNHNESFKVLDIGCGYGVIGLVIECITNSKVDMADINKRSVHLTKMNIKKFKSNNNAFYSDAYSEVKDTYDIVITNPPIRVGNEKLLEILIGAKKHLNKEGELWYVIRKDQGGLTIMKKLENIYNIEIKEKKKGYIIFVAKNK